MLDGGRLAARGFLYQYLCTLEQLVKLVHDSQVFSVRVEGPTGETGFVDVVDFDVVAHDGSILLAAQVKSVMPGKTMSASTALAVLLDLAKKVDACDYRLITNGAASPRSSSLSQALQVGLDPQQLRQALLELMHDAPQRTAQLLALSEVELTRLGRSRIVFDPRDDDEIREQLRDALRMVRNQARQGLGERSAGLLVGYLLSEVFGRAADVSGQNAMFTVADLRSLLLVGSDTLANVFSTRDWGLVVGALPQIPDVERSEIVSAITARFPPSRALGVREVTLLGPSGIGKSSLAALYIGARADAYDFIGWVDCETDYSALLSFQRLAMALFPATNEPSRIADPDELRDRVHGALGQMPGRWLLVLDNVASRREIRPWMPAAGRGDVVITTINGASHQGQGAVIAIDAMRREESLDLLRRRLHLAPGGESRWEPSLNRLAVELGDWPLALELGAAYLHNCEVEPDGIDGYLRDLRARSLDDADGIPPDYPRTLAAAVTMCIDELQSRADLSDVTHPATAATLVLLLAGYMASHQIPAHLLLAAAIGDSTEADESHVGPMLMAPEIINLGEVLRELRRFSLAGPDLPVPVTYGDHIPGAERTISVNTVSQLIIRERLSTNPNRPEFVGGLLWHLERWLRSSAELGELERTRVLQSHAETLLGHCETMGLTGDGVALLYGNLAAPFMLQGKTRRAEELLLRELEHLQAEVEPNLFLIAQTRLALAAAYIFDRSRTDGPGLVTTFQDAVRHMEHVLAAATEWASATPQSALRLAVEARTMLCHPETRVADRLEVVRLAAAFRDLESRIPPSHLSTTYGSLVHAEQCLRDGRYAEAETLCGQLIAQQLTGSLEAEVRRRYIEAIAAQKKWTEALVEVRFWKHDPQAPRLYLYSIAPLIYNVGLYCLPGLRKADFAARSLFNELLDWPEFESVLNTATPEMAQSIRSMAELRDALARPGA